MTNRRLGDVDKLGCLWWTLLIIFAMLVGAWVLGVIGDALGYGSR